MRAALVVVALALLAGVIAGGTALFTYYQLAGSYDLSKVSQIPSRSEVFDADGVLHGRIDSVNRDVVPLRDVSPLFVKTIVAREDERFYQHHGVDYEAIARAFVRDLSRRGPGARREGGSTITQQLARNSLPIGRERSLHRKLLEAMVAVRIEQRYSKDEILEAYINRIYLGAGVYGVEAAAQRYFGHSAKELSLHEAALLAGIVRSPNTNSPARNPAGARAERDSVLDRLLTLNQATPAEVAAAKAEEVRALPKSASGVTQRDYLMDAVRAQLDDVLGANDLDLGGLRIYTTIDSRLQKAAERAVQTRLEKIEETRGYEHESRADWLKAHPSPGKKEAAKGDATESASPDYLQAALLAVDNKTGAIRAMVGGRSYEESSFNRALARPGRQVGSTFKPFVFAAAFERGMLATTPVEDSPIRPGEFSHAANGRASDPEWSPGNSDGQFLGIVPAETGLIQSRNIMSIRVGEWAGRDFVLRLAQKAGLLDEKALALPSIHLGTFEATPRTLAGAYAAFPNKGVARAPYLIERIDAADGETLFRAVARSGDGGVPVMTAQAAQETSNLLERVLTEGTAKTSKNLGLNVPAAGKTGTTNDFKDAWFAGYTTSLTCAVWVGFDQPKTIMAKGYGSTLALPIWVDFIQTASNVTGSGGNAKRYPALPLHSGSLTPPPAATTPRALAATTGLTPAPPVAQPVVSATPPPPLGGGPSTAQPDPNSQEAGSRYIVDARTGKIIGIDSSEAAAREQALRQQEQQRALTLQQQQQQEQALARQVAAAPRAEPVGPPPDAAGNLPVRRASPVSHVTIVNGQVVRIDDTPVRRAAPVAHTQMVGRPPSNPGTLAPPPVAEPVQAAPTPRRRVVHTQIVTAPDGTRRVETTVENPLGR